uniref:Putative secreted protein n=1 Tax=Anopheles darlingi TaxID=43151 RepID=A0A2M4DFN0_ANODA
MPMLLVASVLESAALEETASFVGWATGATLLEAVAVVVADAGVAWFASTGQSNTQRSFESIRFSGYFFHSSSRLISSSSGFTIDCTMNLCLFFSFESKMNGWSTIAISCDSRGSSRPQFGRTQYFFGAVVLILK